jgi:hypothetical protein
MVAPEINVITGAFGYTGKYITRRLLALGKEVRTLTGHPNNPNPFGEQVRAYPFNFDNFAELVKSLQGATTFYNTYWIRFSHGTNTFEQLVRLMMEKLHKRVILAHVQPGVALFLAKLIEPFLDDVLITHDEIYGLMADLLISYQPPTGHTHLSDWLEAHSASIGKKYASELARHYR